MGDSEAKGSFEVERRTTIAGTSDAVFDRLDDFHRWPEWSPWEGLDPAMERTYEGAPAGVGSVYRWKGNRKAGEGRMEIRESQRPSTLVVGLDFLKPFKSRSTVTFTVTPSGDTTDVTWSMTGPKTFMTRVMGIFTSMDKLVGPDFEKGLAQLKAAVEG